MFDPEEYSDEPIRGKTSPFSQFGWNAKRENGCRRKSFNVKRWLRGHVGEPWDEINSKFLKRKKHGGEWCKTLVDNRWLVTKATKEDGKFYDSKGEEIDDGFAVVDNILYEIVDDRRKYHRASQHEHLANRGIIHIDGRVFIIIDSIWYELILEETLSSCSWYDHYLQTFYSSASTRRFLYGNENYYCKGKRQLNKQEIKRLKLREDQQSE